MVDYFGSFEGSHYIGKIGMRMMARPNAAELKDIFIEPIWVFKRGNSNYIEKNDLSKFFA
jgi:hypothetical protein